jgi:hypothetical protein
LRLSRFKQRHVIEYKIDELAIGIAADINASFVFQEIVPARNAKQQEWLEELDGCTVKVADDARHCNSGTARA